MKADSIMLLEFIGASKRTFYIPVYQRNYDWKRVQCETLFKDLESLIKYPQRESHFMGTVVYVEGDSTATFRAFSVIDGQQRLTTIMLLLKAIADSTDDEDIRDDIIESYLTNKRCPEELRIKLKPMKSDALNYEKLIDGQHKDLEDTQIRNNYNLFVELLNQSEYSIEQIYGAIQKLEIVYISLDAGKENPQLIFESLNSTGLDLTQADLIRNFLLMGQEHENQEYFYNKYWLRLENLLPEANISEFIRDYLTLKTSNIPNMNNVYSCFKDYYKNLSEISTEVLLIELTRFGEYYSWFKFCNSRENSINKRLSHFQKLKSTTVYPFLLVLFESYYNNKEMDAETLISIMDLLLSYIVRRLICDMPSNALNKVFAAIGKDFEKNNDEGYYERVVRFLGARTGKAVFPSNDNVRDNLYDRDFYKFKHAKFVFEEIEKRRTKEVVDFENLTIEHIMPQTLNPKWRIDLGDKADDIHNKYLNCIGNLTLTGYNSELSNDTFDVKKGMYKDSNVCITKELITYSAWDDNTIRKRTLDLSNSITGIWIYPEGMKKITNNNAEKTEFDITDEVNVKGRTPVEVEIMGVIKTVNSWRDFIKAVCSVLYEYDAQLFKRIINHPDFERNGKSLISLSSEGFRTPQEIVEGVYFEMNQNANDILNYTKLIIDKFDGMDEMCSYKLS